MKNKRIVISGSPGAGKTSIIKGLKNKGYTVFEEYSRILIDEGKASGKANFFLLFSIHSNHQQELDILTFESNF